MRLTKKNINEEYLDVSCQPSTLKSCTLMPYPSIVFPITKNGNKVNARLSKCIPRLQHKLCEYNDQIIQDIKSSKKNLDRLKQCSQNTLCYRPPNGDQELCTPKPSKGHLAPSAFKNNIHDNKLTSKFSHNCFN